MTILIFYPATTEICKQTLGMLSYERSNYMFLQLTLKEFFD